MRMLFVYVQPAAATAGDKLVSPAWLRQSLAHPVGTRPVK